MTASLNLLISLLLLCIYSAFLLPMAHTRVLLVTAAEVESERNDTVYKGPKDLLTLVLPDRNTNPTQADIDNNSLDGSASSENGTISNSSVEEEIVQILKSSSAEKTSAKKARRQLKLADNTTSELTTRRATSTPTSATSDASSLSSPSSLPSTSPSSPSSLSASPSSSSPSLLSPSSSSSPSSPSPSSSPTSSPTLATSPSATATSSSSNQVLRNRVDSSEVAPTIISSTNSEQPEPPSAQQVLQPFIEVLKMFGPPPEPSYRGPQIFPRRQETRYGTVRRQPENEIFNPFNPIRDLLNLNVVSPGEEQNILAGADGGSNKDPQNVNPLETLNPFLPQNLIPSWINGYIPQTHGGAQQGPGTLGAGTATDLPDGGGNALPDNSYNYLTNTGGGAGGIIGNVLPRDIKEMISPIGRILEGLSSQGAGTRDDQLRIGRDRTVDVLGLPVGRRDGVRFSPLDGVSVGNQDLFGPVAVNDNYDVNWGFLGSLGRMFERTIHAVERKAAAKR